MHAKLQVSALGKGVTSYPIGHDLTISTSMLPILETFPILGMPYCSGCTNIEWLAHGQLRHPLYFLMRKWKSSLAIFSCCIPNIYTLIYVYSYTWKKFHAYLRMQSNIEQQLTHILSWKLHHLIKTGLYSCKCSFVIHSLHLLV